MLSFWTYALASIASGLFIFFHLYTNLHRKRRKGEPPVLSGHPVWGSAKGFSLDAITYLQNAAKKHGHVFTMRLINQYVTVIMDPHSYEEVHKERAFNFDAIQKQVNWNVFQFVLRNAPKVLRESGRTVRGAQMLKGMQNFGDNLDIAFRRAAHETQWRDGLRQFAVKTLFDAQLNTIFGRADGAQFNSQHVYKNFDGFHKYFNFFWLGLPKCLFPKALEHLRELVQACPSSDELLSRGDTSDYIRSAMLNMRDEGQSEGDMAGHNLVYLHVNYNTFRLAFWVLNNLLQYPEAMEALKNEINEVLEEHKDQNTNVATLNTSIIEKMKYLDSITNESIRLSSGVFMVRVVTHDVEFTTAIDNETHSIRAGDRVAIYPPAIHKDPEIFEEPMKFKYDRFVDAKFYKNGRQIKHPLMAFGSLCPGKRYALLQLKWYVLNVVTRYQLESLSGQFAQYAYEYHGHEILPPTSDIDITITTRTDAPQLQFSR